MKRLQLFLNSKLPLNMNLRHRFSVGLVVLFGFSVQISAQGILGKSFGTLDADAINRYDYQQIKDRMARTSKEESVFLKWLEQNQEYNYRQTNRSGVTSSRLNDSIRALPFVTRNIFQDTIVFGSDLFSPFAKLDFAPNIQTAYNPNYRIGPGDELDLTIYGLQSASYQLKVRSDGTIEIPYAGVIGTSGLSIKDLELKIKQSLVSKGYEPMRSGRTSLHLAVTKIRSINVHVIGAQEPGTYTVPAIATAMHVLYEAGGPGPFGTYRNIQIIRSGKVVGTLDLYELIQNGNSGDIFLEDNDVLRIPVYEQRVNLSGEFIRSGLYEIKSEEHLDNLLAFSGGFSEAAYRGSVTIFRIDSTELSVHDVSKSEYSSFSLKSGDVIIADPVRNRFNNRVAITGGVVKPGYYALTPGMTVGDLIKRASGLDRRAVGSRGYLRRNSDDSLGQYIDFDLAAASLELYSNDSIYIPSQLDLKLTDSIHVRGFVHRPENFIYYNGLTLEQAILLAGGIRSDGDLFRVEVSLPIQENGAFTGKAKIVEISPNWSGEGTPLAPGATVSVRQRPYLNTSKVVFVVGAVRTPGGYSLERDGEPLRKVLDRVGSFNEDALPQFGMVVRNLGFEVEEEQGLVPRKTQSLQDFAYLSDTTDLKKKDSRRIRRADTIALDLTSRISLEEFRLQNGDTLIIPRRLNTVNIRGAVLNPGGMTFQNGKRALFYVRRTGGLSPNAVRKSLRVEYANGQSAGLRYALGIVPIYPKVYSNSTIKVEMKDLDVRKVDPAQLSAVGSFLASISSVTLSVLYLLR